MSKNIKNILLIAGLNLLVAVGWFWLYRQTILSFQVAPKVVATTQYRAPLPTKVKIKSAQIEVPLIVSHITNGTWETTKKGASFLSDSARPGEGGNIVMYGHNTLDIFGRMRSLKPGETIHVQVADGNWYEYRVESTSIVKPHQIDAVLPTKTEILTLYTCTGWMDSQRFIVRAVPTQILTALTD